MKKKLLSLLALTLSAVLILSSLSAFALAEEKADAEEYEDAFTLWNKDAASLNALLDYVEAVTDESSPDFIPVDDRIAVFDMDGTLMGELFPTYLEYYMLAWRILKDPTCQPDEEMLKVGRTLRDCALTNSFPSDMPMQHAIQAARAYSGMTLGEFADFVTQILNREADGFENMTYASCFYLPMVEVVEYLQENDFTCYVVSGSDRFICRTFIEGMLDIPYANIIGMDVQLAASKQGDEDPLNYVFTAEDSVVRTDKLLVKNLKTNKVLQIAQDIGMQPVLSFGNSSGDVSMHNYTINNNPFRSAAFMLIADDSERDYGSAERVQPLKEKWEASGYTVISMANDWKTIYGEDVVKTNEFHWMEELAEDRVAVVSAPEEAAAADTAQAAASEMPQEEKNEDIQYVMYLGTNDKDTNKPVFTQEEAKEQARDILIRHFGGYTLQEANGGWMDDGKVYQEYTLVIYLSDTTEEKVHAAADELLKVFNQSSVLIQQNPTKTEFYAAE
jgi:phosphoserine phosphatase